MNMDSISGWPRTRRSPSGRIVPKAVKTGWAIGVANLTRLVRATPRGTRSNGSTALKRRALPSRPCATSSSPVVGTTGPSNPAATTRDGSSCAAGQRVGAAPRQPDHHEALVSEPVGDRGHVGRPVAHLGVGVVGGVTHTGAFHADQTQAQLLRGPAADQRDLPAGARRAVEPQHQGPGGVAVLGEAQAAAVGQRDGALQAGRWAGRDAER